MKNYKKDAFDWTLKFAFISYILLVGSFYLMPILGFPLLFLVALEVVSSKTFFIITFSPFLISLGIFLINFFLPNKNDCVEEYQDPFKMMMGELLSEIKMGEKEKEIMDALDLTNEIKEKKKESRNTDMLPGYVRFRVNIKKTSREKFWALKKKLGKSFGQLLTQWINEKYIENFEKEEKKV